MKKRIIALGCIGFLGLMGCGAPMGNRLNILEGLGDQILVKSSGHGGRQTLVVGVRPPQESALGTQAVIHRWVGQDVYQYELVLDGGKLKAPVTAILLAKGGQSKVAFTHLKVNTAEPYMLSVIAKGNVGGTAPESILNAKSPATKTFSFSGDNDVEDTQSLEFSVKLDDVPFDGTAAVGLTPVDGGYEAPGDEGSVVIAPATDSPTPDPEPTMTPAPTPTATPSTDGEGFFNLLIRFDQ